MRQVAYFRRAGNRCMLICASLRVISSLREADIHSGCGLRPQAAGGLFVRGKKNAFENKGT